MIRRESLDQPVNHDRWLVSYADFITLLFAFFVVMYSISYVNEDKYRSLAETLNAAFSKTSGPAESQMLKADFSPAELADLNDLQEALEQTLAGFQIAGELIMGANEQWLELSLSSELLFASGSAEPSAKARALFGELATSLEPINNEIQISGHTDNIPINNQNFANNWALSSARAIAIVDYLSFQGVDAQRLSAVAFGEHRPLAANDTEQGRAQNRRVVIRVGRGEAEPTEHPTSEVSNSSALGENSVLQKQGAKQNTDGVNGAGSTSAADKTTTLAQPELSGTAAASVPNTVQPVTLEGGDLLFTSDPDLPRLRRRQSEAETASPNSSSSGGAQQ